MHGISARSENVQETGTLIGSELCTKCGLCCTGALHHYAVLKPEEEEFAEGLGLELRQIGRPGFKLPCPLLNGCSCTVYLNRPAVCGRYKCQLLQDVESGATELQAAIAKVAKAKDLVLDVESQLPAEVSLPQAREQFFRDEEPTNSSRKSMLLKLALTALCLYLDKHFKHGNEAKLLTLEPLRSPHEMEME